MAAGNAHDRLARVLGTTNPVVVDVFDTAGGVAATLPASMLAATTIHRGRAGATDDTSPATLGTLLAGPLTVGDRQLTVGRAVRLRLSDAALDTLFGSHVSAPALEAKARFTGQVSDLGEVELIARARTAQTPMTATGIYARVASAYEFNSGIVAAGTSDVDLLRTVLPVVQNQDPGVNIAEWALGANHPLWYAPLAARTPVAADRRFTAWDMSNTTPAAVIADLIASTGGLLIERRDGRLDWLIPEARRAVPVSVTLDASQVLSPVKAKQDLADLIDLVEVTWGEPAASEWVADLAAGAVSGTYFEKRATRLATAAAAADLGTNLVGRYAWPLWKLSAVTVDLTQLIDDGQLTTVQALLSIEPGALIELTGLPTTSPVRGGFFWAEGSDETITEARWQLTLSLVAYGLLAPPVRWSELPTGLRWIDVPADVSWLGATGWQPEPYPIAAYRTTPANVRYSDLPATAWADYERT